MRIRLFTAAAATTALLATAGAAYAEPDEPPENEPGPGLTTTIEADYTVTLPRGYACDVAVEARFVGTVTVGVSQDSKIVTIMSPDGVWAFENLKTGESIERTADGSFVDITRKDGSLKEYGFGRNFYAGKGIRGILGTGPDSVQRLDVLRPYTPRQVLKVRSVTGPTEQVCHTLGAKAVRGKNPPPPSDPAARAVLPGL